MTSATSQSQQVPVTLLESTKKSNEKDQRLSHLPLVTVPSASLQDLILQSSVRAYSKLTSFADLFPSMSDSDRKKSLLRYCQETRNTFLKLLVAMRFKDKISDLSLIQKIHAFIDTQDMAFAKTADDLFQIHNEMKRAKICNYDVLTAVDVLVTGKYQRLPSIIKKRFTQSKPENQDEKTLNLKAQVEDMIRLRLLTSEVLPPPFRRNMIIENGTVTFTIPNGFLLQCTLQSKQGSQFWKLLSIQILTRSKEGYEGVSNIVESQIQQIAQVVQGHFLTSTEPLLTVYRMLHDLILRYKVDIMTKQIQALSKSPSWADKVTFQNTARMLKIHYWVGPVYKEGDRVISIQVPEPPPQSTTTISDNTKILETSLDALVSKKGDSDLIFRHFFVDRDAGRVIRETFDSDQFDFRTVDVQNVLFTIAQTHAVNLLKALHAIILKEFSEDKLKLFLKRDSIETETIQVPFVPSTEAVSDAVLSINYYGNEWIHFVVDLRSGEFTLLNDEAHEGEESSEGKLTELAAKMDVTQPDTVFSFLNYLSSKTLASHVRTLALSLDYKTVEPLSLPSQVALPDPKDCIFLQKDTNPNYTLMISVDSAWKDNNQSSLHQPENFNAQFYIWLICIKFAGAYSSQTPHVLPLSPSEVLDPVSIWLSGSQLSKIIKRRTEASRAEHHWTALDLPRLENIQTIAQKTQILLDTIDHMKKMAWEFHFVIPGLDFGSPGSESYKSLISSLSYPRLARLNPYIVVSPYSICVTRNRNAAAFSWRSKTQPNNRTILPVYTKPSLDCSNLYFSLKTVQKRVGDEVKDAVHVIAKVYLHPYIQPYFEFLKEQVDYLSYDSDKRTITYEEVGPSSLVSEMNSIMGPVFMMLWWLSQLHPFRKALEKSGIKFYVQSLHTLHLVFHEQVFLDLRWYPAKDRLSVSLDALSIQGKIDAQFSTANGETSGFSCLSEWVESSLRSDGNILRPLEAISQAYPVLHSMGSLLCQHKLAELGQINLLALSLRHYQIIFGEKYSIDITYESPDMILFCDVSTTTGFESGFITSTRDKSVMNLLPQLRSDFESPFLSDAASIPKAQNTTGLGLLNVLEMVLPTCAESVWYMSLPHGLVLPRDPAVWEKVGTILISYANAACALESAGRFLGSENGIEISETRPFQVSAVVHPLDGTNNPPSQVVVSGSVYGAWNVTISSTSRIYSEDDKQILNSSISKKLVDIQFIYPILTNVLRMTGVSEVMKEMVQICRNEDIPGTKNIVAEWLLSTPISDVDDENLKYLPGKSDIGFLVEPGSFRVSLLIRYRDVTSNESVIVPYRYNYGTGIIDVWRIHQSDSIDATTPVSSTTSPFESDSLLLQQKCHIRTSISPTDMDLNTLRSVFASQMRTSGPMEKVLLHVSSRDVPVNVSGGLKLNLVLKHLRTSLTIPELRQEAFSLLRATSFGSPHQGELIPP